MKTLFDEDEVLKILEHFRNQSIGSERHITRHALKIWWENKLIDLNERKKLEHQASFVES